MLSFHRHGLGLIPGQVTKIHKLCGMEIKKKKKSKSFLDQVNSGSLAAVLSRALNLESEDQVLTFVQPLTSHATSETQFLL